MEEAVYALCAGTALTSAVLLLRAFASRGVRILLWCGLFFVALGIENVILLIDRAVVPDIDLSPLRNSVAFAGVALLVGALVWGMPSDGRGERGSVP